jgi:hypothetical protein
MHEPRPELGVNVFETSPFGQRDQSLTSLACLVGIGPRRGVEQPQPCDPVGGEAHDFEGDVAAHRQPRQGETLGRVPEQPLRDRLDGVVLRMVGDDDPPGIGEGGALRLEQLFGAVQSGHENESIGHRLLRITESRIDMRAHDPMFRVPSRQYRHVANQRVAPSLP